MGRFVVALAVASIACPQSPIHAADWGTNCWRSFWTDFHRNNCWPEPFLYPERAAVCEYVSLQTIQGWQLQNLLGDPHFDADSSRLSPAGVAKVQAILTQNPPAYRTVFVQRGLNDEITAQRLEAAQRVAVDYARGGMPDVLVSDMQLIGTPAEYINLVNTKYMQGIPTPALPPQTTSGTSLSQ